MAPTDAGAAVGLAVLVTVFDSIRPAARSAGLSQLAGAHGGAAAAIPASLVHGLDVTFAAGAGFALAALAIAAVFVRSRASAEVPVPVRMEDVEAAA